MRQGGGRAKGSSFEREIATAVVEAFKDFGITKQDCYRTPLSGGHIFAKGSDPGDLVLSPKLRELFPFSVECKFYKKLHLHALWVKVEKQKRAWKFRDWLEQTCKACSAKSEEIHPMLIFKGNNLPTFVAVPTLLPVTTKIKPRLTFDYQGEEWIICMFDDFLRKWVRNVERKSKEKR